MDGSQVDFVGKYIKEHESGISSMEAFDYGITRLSHIIYVLRKRGLIIENIDCKCKNRYGHTTNYVRYVYRGERV